MLKIMTPGPTQVRENVRMARSLVTTNPDLDLEFYDFYKETCDMLASFFDTKNPFYILSGEGILGLEAACASLTEAKDRVLVIDNGIFGKGFADFVKIYGGEAVLYSVDELNLVNPSELKKFLEKDHDFKYATLVHCDTPSGMLNDVKTLCCLLQSYGILTVVDSVSASFGEPLSMDKAEIDILCGGSQKALSAPVGLTFLGISPKAIQAMEQRKTPIASFYANILNYKSYYENKWFPYTMPISDIYGFRAALENVVQDEEIFARHEKIARAVRIAVKKAGLQLHLESGYSNTVTVFNVPDGMKDTAILEIMKEQYNIMLAGCFDSLAGKVIRIGHMGENANISDVAETLWALTDTFRELGHPLACDMRSVFFQELS